MTMIYKYTKKFSELSNDKVALVGGKNASLGEMFNQLSPKGIKIPDGFATTAEAYWLFLDENNIRPKLTALMNKLDLKEYRLTEKGSLIATGKAVGSKIVSGVARVLDSPAEAHKLQVGEILVTDITNPDWNIVLKKESVIITNKGGRTSHAAIVARELGVAAVVGTTNATQKIKRRTINHCFLCRGR